jgi:hypothetical protein
MATSYGRLNTKDVLFKKEGSHEGERRRERGGGEARRLLRCEEQGGTGKNK